MKGTLEKQGRYVLFETTSGHQTLSFEQRDWFVLVDTAQGQLIVLPDSDHERKETLQKDNFYLAHFDGDPEFEDQPHLFLQHRQGAYDEFVLPNGLPTPEDQ